MDFIRQCFVLKIWNAKVGKERDGFSAVWADVSFYEDFSIETFFYVISGVKAVTFHRDGHFTVGVGAAFRGRWEGVISPLPCVFFRSCMYYEYYLHFYHSPEDILHNFNAKIN